MAAGTEVSSSPDPDEEFTAHRPLLFSIAYEILGSVGDAEDVLQDSYLRWRTVDLTEIGNPRAYLARIVTREAITIDGVLDQVTCIEVRGDLVTAVYCVRNPEKLAAIARRPVTEKMPVTTNQDRVACRNRGMRPTCDTASPAQMPAQRPGLPPRRERGRGV